MYPCVCVQVGSSTVMTSGLYVHPTSMSCGVSGLSLFSFTFRVRERGRPGTEATMLIQLTNNRHVTGMHNYTHCNEVIHASCYHAPVCTAALYTINRERPGNVVRVIVPCMIFQSPCEGLCKKLTMHYYMRNPTKNKTKELFIFHRCKQEYCIYPLLHHFPVAAHGSYGGEEQCSQEYTINARTCIH